MYFLKILLSCFLLLNLHGSKPLNKLSYLRVHSSSNTFIKYVKSNSAVYIPYNHILNIELFTYNIDVLLKNIQCIHMYVICFSNLQHVFFTYLFIIII